MYKIHQATRRCQSSSDHCLLLWWRGFACEKANRLYVKNISDYITTPDTKYLYSIDDNHLIWIENTPSYEKIPNEVCRLQIYNHPPLSVERELKEEYFKK